MSNKLPIVKVKLLEKVLLYLGFEIKRQKAVMFFIGILTGDILPYPIMAIRKSGDLC